MAKSSQKQLKNRLVEIGVHPNDADVYLALLSVGATTAGSIIANTGLHRNVVYTSLQHLLDRKLISEKQVKGKKTFSPARPDVLVAEWEQKAALAKSLADDLKERLPVDVDVTVHQGNEEYLALLTSLIGALPKGATKYVMGTGGEDFMARTMRPIWEDYHKVARRQKIRIRMLGYASQREAIASDVDRESMYEVRYLADAVENPAGIQIYPELGVVLHVIYSDETTPVTAIRVDHPALVDGYLRLFNGLWKQAKP